MRLLLDPWVLTDFPPSDEEHGRVAFWARLVDWATDARVCVGATTHQYVYETYASHGYPEHDLGMYPAALRTEYRRAISTLLSRVAVHAQPARPASMLAVYLGSLQAAEAIQSDASGTYGAEVAGIATEPSHWEDTPETVRFEPPPPAHLELCTEPGRALKAEESATCHAYFENRRIHIIGGQPTDRVVEEIQNVSGLPEGDINWIASEKGKPARDIKNRWGGLHAERDVTLCITGRIGHAQSKAASTAADKWGVPHMQVESAGEIPEELRRLVHLSAPGR